MPLLNTITRWGWVQMLLHWSVAVTIIGLFALGLWMTGLDYYSPWYQTAPDLHRNIGLLLLAVMLLRLLWRLPQAVPQRLSSHSQLEHRAAHLAHALIYLLVVAIIVTGYLISTADGRAIDFFGWFELPALIESIPDQEDLMGEWHEIAAWTLAVLVALHAGGALKHHLVDRDSTLKRMLPLKISSNPQTPNGA